MQWYQQLQETSNQCMRAFEGLASSKDSQVGRGASQEFSGHQSTLNSPTSQR